MGWFGRKLCKGVSVGGGCPGRSFMSLQPHEEGSLSWGPAARMVCPRARQRAGAGETEVWGDKRTCDGRGQGGLFSPDSPFKE